jgi:hypothetical protein
MAFSLQAHRLLKIPLKYWRVGFCGQEGQALAIIRGRRDDAIWHASGHAINPVEMWILCDYLADKGVGRGVTESVFRLGTEAIST